MLDTVLLDGQEPEAVHIRGNNNPATVTMNGPIEQTVSFSLNDISVTVNTSPAGRSFTVDGTTYTTQQVFSWQPGSSHTLLTTSPQSGGTGTQYVWTNWSDGGNISHTVSPTVNSTYTANFDTEYYLTMTSAQEEVLLHQVDGGVKERVYR